MFGIDLSIALGLVSGLALNAVKCFRGPAGLAATRLLPHAVRLAVKVAKGEDAREDADALLKLAPGPLAAQLESESDDTDVKPPRKAKPARRS